MAWELALPFILAAFTFAVMPGPGILYCVARSVAHGMRAGLMAALASSARVQHWTLRMGGALLIGLGLNLALDRST
ncbi:MAG: hypothetical protein AAFY38_10945 [Pseudomonadota bacterium]